jgi:outer membrane protein assembly factor BamB
VSRAAGRNAACRLPIGADTEAMKYTVMLAAFADDFYDDLVIGAWRMMSIGAVVSSPVVAAGRIYFGSTDGNVYAVH